MKFGLKFVFAGPNKVLKKWVEVLGTDRQNWGLILSVLQVLSNPNWSSNTETCSGAIVESSSSIELQPIRKQVTSLSAPGSASSSSNTAPLSARDYHRGQMVSVERQTPALSSTASNTPHPLEEMVPNTGTQAALITQPPVKKVPVVQEDVFGDAKECPFTVASASSPSSVELFSSFRLDSQTWPHSIDRIESFPRPRLSSSTSSRSEVPSAKAEGQIISISQSSPVEVSAVSTPTTIVVRQAASASAKDPPLVLIWSSWLIVLIQDTLQDCTAVSWGSLVDCTHRHPDSKPFVSWVILT